jgi:hypothetical protein
MKISKGNKVTIICKSGTRPCTQEEVDAWYDSPDSKGMNCAGETKLAPRITSVPVDPEGVYTVLRSRCAPVLGYYKRSGQVLVESRTGESFYIHRDAVKVIDAKPEPVKPKVTASGEQDDFEVALESFVGKLQTNSDEHFATQFPNYPKDQISRIVIDPSGRKYKRIVKKEGSSRSVHCFVEVATGDIWKAASWKAPAKNFPRGNIYNDDPTKGTSVYGANYAR